MVILIFRLGIENFYFILRLVIFYVKIVVLLLLNVVICVNV